MDNIVITSLTTTLLECVEVSEKLKLFNKQIQKTLRNKTYSRWSGSFKTFTLVFDKITLENYEKLEIIFLNPDSNGKIFIFRGVSYVVCITDDVLDFKEEFSTEFNRHLYSGTINLEEISNL